MLCKMGLSCHPTTVATKLKELRKDHDKELLAWKGSLEFNDEIKKCKKMLTTEAREVAYLPQPPSTDDFRAHAEFVTE